jgi:glucosylceramidase
MSRFHSSITSACLAILFGACGSGTNNGATGGTVGSGGTSSSSSSGSSANPGGGNTSNPGGGNTSNPGGGNTSNPGGGNTSNPGGGNTSNPGGGNTTNPGGGNTTNPGGGSSANPGGGNTTNPGGGTTANPKGGTTANPGGAVAGASATGGSQAGSGAAGSTAAGGDAVPSTALVTSANGSYWKTATWTEAPSGTADVTVSDTAAQTWDGFGGAFNERGWSYLTTQEMKDQAIQLLFGTDGANFAWGRIPMGASDYAINRYTDDETANDTSMAGFNIDQDKKYLIPYIQAALKVKPDIRFWASPWTPPTWMKTTPCNPNSGKSNSMFDGCVMKSDDAVLKAHAQYFVKWVAAFKDQGIKVEYVAPQNEPNYEQNYPSCHWASDVFTKFVGQYLGPALTSANSPAQIMLGTLSNNGSSADVSVANAVLADATAKGYCKVVGVQWGMSDANQVSNIKGKTSAPIWLSETKCGGTTGSTAPAPNDFSYAKDTWGYIRDAIKNGLTAYNAWNMVLDKGGLGNDDTRKWPQNALLVADGTTVTATPAYYVYRHFSQFVVPGAKVLGTSGSTDAAAFKNPDGSTVAVVYAASAKTNYIVSVAGKKLQFSMPAGWATIKYK